MNRIEVNVVTGERKVIELTPQEEADALVRTAEEAARPKSVNVFNLMLDYIASRPDAPQLLKDEAAKRPV